MSMDLAYAYRVAASFDYNRDGEIRTRGFNKEIEFDSNARKLTDWNKDGKISLDEFANSLARGDVFVGIDREVHSANPYGPTSPGGYPYPGGGSPYYPGPQGPVIYSGPGYYGGGAGGQFGNIVGGAAIGGAVGYIANGNKGLENGAVIGGFIGAIGNLFR